jgi:hypothetical protein
MRYLQKNNSYSRGTTIVQVNLILDVKVRTPVTDLSSTFVLGKLQDREVVVEVKGDQLLVFVDESMIRRRCNVVVRSISNRCARFSYRAIKSELC